MGRGAHGAWGVGRVQHASLRLSCPEINANHTVKNNRGYFPVGNDGKPLEYLLVSWTTTLTSRKLTRFGINLKDSVRFSKKLMFSFNT